MFMTEMVIENGIVIDDVESVLCGIRELSNRKLEAIDTIKKFIISEKNTKFYVDNKLNSYMQPDSECTYIWLDTGYIDTKGNPILISLIKGFGGFAGHLVGNIYMLAENIRAFFKLKRNVVSDKIASFKNKYKTKIDDRRIKHIESEQEYLINSCNSVDEDFVFAQKFAELGIDISNFEVEKESIAEDTIEEEITETFSKLEEEITIGLLLEKMECMQADIDELLQLVDNISTKSNLQIEELQKKNEEYKMAIVQMRLYSQTEPIANKEVDDMTGHDLLGNHSKILVIGGEELGVNVMQGIAKLYGFDKKDFDYVAYDKAKDFMERIRRNGKYKAIIYGACPHKTTDNAGYSSAIEKMKNVPGMPYVVDARNQSGKLKVTKGSFKAALESIYQNIRLAYAG